MNTHLVRPIPALLVMLFVTAALATFVASAAPPASALSNQDYYFISSVGPAYGGGHTFDGYAPYGVATDSAGSVYVTLPFGIAKFYSNGSLACTYTGDGGSYTMGPGYGLDLDGRGVLYVVESDVHRVAILHPDGYGSYALSSLTGRGGGNGTSGQGNGEFNNPWDLAVDGSYLYVADTYNSRIQKFSIDTNSNTLAWVASWGKNGGNGTQGSGNGEFSYPTGIAADHAGHIFVADTENHRIQELTTSGAFVTAWGVGTPTTDPLYFCAARGIEVDGHGNVYVTDSDASTSWVDKFAPSGSTFERLTRFGGTGTQDSQFDHPWGVAIAPNGYVYIADVHNSKLKKFAMDATPPIVTMSGVPAGWTNQNVNALFTATDPAVDGQYTSQLDYIWVSPTGAGVWYGYTSPHTFVVTAEGDMPLNYYAEDHALNSSTPVTVHVRIDKTAPTTTVAGIPSTWSRTPVVATFSPSDALSGVASTAYSTDGSTWTTSGNATIGAQGATTVSFHSTDVAGNTETTRTATVRIDSTAPTTTVTGVPTGWSKTAVTATLTPDDALSRVASTEYSTNGGAAWTTGTSVVIGAQGATTLSYRSTDNAGNVETADTVTARIDALGPQTLALAKVSVTWGKKATFRFRINDLTPTATATIRIYKGKVLKKTLSVGSRPTGSAQSCKWLCKLARGSYTWKVYARDLAGNAQRTLGWKTLTVR
jgi:sugar lactone lactonase YvrE